MAFLDQKEITHFLAQELLYQQYINLEGLNSGVPTRTTPTLTPTTLRNIEQTFIELQSKPEPHENEAGFVPPLVHSIGNNQYISASEANSDTLPNLWHSSLSQSSSDCDTRSTPPLSLLSHKSTPSSGGQTRRNMGGRKPNKDFDCSPEEEERRRIRRERNKAAAARCRKRRVDHTNALIIETDELERKKANLQDEIYDLQNTKEQLECLLTNHKASSNCRLETSSPPEVKPFNNNHYMNLMDNERVKKEFIEPNGDVFHLPSSARKVMLSSTVSICKPNRPNSLNVGITAPKNTDDVLGIPLSTPSTGMTFNFDSLMGGGTGLTPVSGPLVPSCSSQQRNMHIPVSMADMVSPDACGPPKLVSL